MPILVRTAVPTEPPPRDTRFDETRTLAFRTLDGKEFYPLNGIECAGLNGMTGLDAPPIKVTASAGEIVTVSYDQREVFIPLFVQALTGHAAFLSLRDQLDDMFSFFGVNVTREGGTFDLVANSIRGERTLRCLYVGGREGTLSRSVAGAWYESVGLNLLAVRPLWSGEEWATPPLRRPRPLLFFDAFPPELGVDGVLSVPTLITVPGREASYATVNAVGPCDSLTVTTEGLSVSVPDGLAEGEQCQIVTGPGPRRTAVFDGVKDWSRVAATAQWQPLAPGTQLIQIDMDGADFTSEAWVAGRGQYRGPW